MDHQNPALSELQVRDLLNRCREAHEQLGLVCCVALVHELSHFDVLPEEARLTAGMGERRRRDFILGRLAARRALALLGVPPVPILAEQGRPLFPRPTIGAISHSGGVGMALVASGQALATVGVDIEVRRLSLRATRRLCDERELEWVFEPRSQQARAERATAVFSAKESAFKALIKSDQRGLTPRDIALAPGAVGFTAVVHHQGSGRVAKLEGGWRFGRAVVTWAVTRAHHAAPASE